ncbi:hypothetical protein L9F63_016942, partial [Diploptera punctata]
YVKLHQYINRFACRRREEIRVACHGFVEDLRLEEVKTSNVFRHVSIDLNFLNRNFRNISRNKQKTIPVRIGVNNYGKMRKLVNFINEDLSHGQIESTPVGMWEQDSRHVCQISGLLAVVLRLVVPQRYAKDCFRHPEGNKSQDHGKQPEKLLQDLRP